MRKHNIIHAGRSPRVSRQERAAFHNLITRGPSTRNLRTLLLADWLPETLGRVVVRQYARLSAREQTSKAQELLRSPERLHRCHSLGGPGTLSTLVRGEGGK